MFDARSILDILLGGQGPRGSRQGQPADPNIFREMLDQLGTQDTPPGAERRTAPQQTPGGRWPEQRYPQPSQDTSSQPAQPPPGGGMSLEELLRTILTGGVPQQQAPAGGQQQTAPPGGQTRPAINPEVTKELQDLLRQILQGGARGGGPAAPGAQASRFMGEGGGAGGGSSGASGMGETLRQVLGQATAGAREGAARIDEATGLSDKAREALGQATGQTPEELVAKLKELIANNQLAAGAALGGLGALVLGTNAGRSLATAAVKLGGLALIGGLAYKAYQNYEKGVVSGDQPAKPQALMPAPQGSGFETDAMSDDVARRCIRAMIAAAAADGRIDGAEQQKIAGGLRQAGIAETAQRFLAAEIGSPANVAELASGVASPEEAVQVYTAARIAVDPDTGEEHAFLSALANALGIDRELAAQVDAAARGTAA